ncbi:MAG: DUF3301 domain-containing protein [Gammaproteobacteria bacterium]|nr:DUF3301 domain-containing protein [Gammaproteobacteria bacterium]
MNAELFLILFLSLVIVYWLDAMRVKEIARSACQRACSESDVVFLDDTVFLSRFRLQRNAMGQVALFRQYQFEFTSDGSSRYQGNVQMLGKRVQSLHMDVFRI